VTTKIARKILISNGAWRGKTCKQNKSGNDLVFLIGDLHIYCAISKNHQQLAFLFYLRELPYVLEE
jgi:hypothetical protein